jgi:membrane protease YdiL (CAAX protease family)
MNSGRGRERGAGRARHRVLAALVYGAMCTCAGVIGWARGASLLRTDALIPAVASSLGSVVLGGALAAVTIASTRVLVARAAWARRLRADFRALLADAGPGDAAWLALTSGIGEELLFRGALLPWWGLGLSSLAFGALHVGPARRFLAWTAWATLMGALFGAIYLATGHLEGCVLAHVLVNLVNLRFVLAFDGRLDEADARPGEQALVSSRRVRRE